MLNQKPVTMKNFFTDNSLFLFLLNKKNLKNFIIPIRLKAFSKAFSLFRIIK